MDALMDRPRDEAWLKFLKKWLGLSLVMHLLAAIYSVGYFDVDEHFQILEFLNARLGRSSYADLTWEFTQRNRPWMEVMFFELPTRLLMALGVQDPFRWACAIKIIVALIGWASLVGLAYCCYFWFEKMQWRQWAVRLICLFWFAPFLHARTSSENLGGSLFVMAIVAYELYPRLKIRESRGLLITGGFLGLSFMTRFQMGFAHVGFGLWLLIFGKVRDPKRIALLAAGFVATVGFAVILDRIGYGEWTLSPWMYYRDNVILGHARSLGTSPFHYYVKDLWNAMAVLGPLLVIGSLWGWLCRPSHLVSFVSLFFVFCNSLVAHKEARFIFPMATAMPVVVTFGLERIRWPGGLGLRLLKIAAVLVLVLDVGTMAVMALKPAYAQVGFYEAVYRHEPKIQELWHGDLDPYAPFSVKLNFYRPDGLSERRYTSLGEVRQALRPDRELWFFYENFELSGDAEGLREYCRLEYTTFPSWLNSLTFLPGPRRFANRWSLYRCRL